MLAGVVNAMKGCSAQGVDGVSYKTRDTDMDSDKAARGSADKNHAKRGFRESFIMRLGQDSENGMVDQTSKPSMPEQNFKTCP